MSDYVIAGDTKEHKDCLVYVCGTYKCAEEALHRMLTNPNNYDKKLMEEHFNLRIEEVPDERCWWHGNCD